MPQGGHEGGELNQGKESLQHQDVGPSLSSWEGKNTGQATDPESLSKSTELQEIPDCLVIH